MEANAGTIDAAIRTDRSRCALWYYPSEGLHLGAKYAVRRIIKIDYKPQHIHDAGKNHDFKPRNHP